MDLNISNPILQQSKNNFRKTRNTPTDEHSVKIYPSIEDLTGTKGISACSICGKSFKRPGYLQHHASCHTETASTSFVQPKITYMCPVDTCTHHTMKGFTAYHSLRRHFLRTHVARTLSCPKAGCNKRFSFPADLKAHLQFCGQKLYCEICGQILSAPSSLRIHKMRKHNINNSTNSYTEENFKPILHLKNNDFIIRRDGEEDEETEKEEEEREEEMKQQQEPPPPPSLIKPKTQKLEENISVSCSGFFIPPSSSSFEFLIPSSNHKSSFTPVIPSPNTLSIDYVSNENILNSYSLERLSLNLINNSNINITPIKKKQEQMTMIFPESITTASLPPPIPIPIPIPEIQQQQQQILPTTAIRSQNSEITFISPINTPITPPAPPCTPCTTPNSQYNSNYNLSFFPPLPPPPTTLLLDDDFQQQQQLFMNNYMMVYPNSNNNSMYNNNNIFPK